MSGKIVGIMGGMGPEATVDLMARVIRGTPAEDDIDHIRMVVDNNPKVPSRIRALLDGGGESPVHCLQDMARRLAAWGVDFLAMPCNTAHYFHKEIQDAVSIPVLDMISLAVARAADSNPNVESVGLLASTATVNLDIYGPAAAQRGLALLTPTPAVQADLMAAIRRIKTGRYGEETVAALQDAAETLVQGGAGALLVACTELSVLSHRIRAGCPVLDSAQILAEAIVREANR